MIKKCEHAGCTRAGTCRAPKDRNLKEYWYFCPEHAAEYNKNWNYYAGMTEDEIEADWETQIFGAPLKDKTNNVADQDYIKFLNDFLTGRNTFDRMPPRRTLPGPVMNALKIFELPMTATWNDVSKKYHSLAKQHHPDTAHDKKNATIKFTQISNAYAVLKGHFGK